TILMREAACRWNCLPAAVSVVPVLLRVNSSAPRCSSKRWIRALTVDWVMCSLLAASTKLPVATTTRKVRASSVSIASQCRRIPVACQSSGSLPRYYVTNCLAWFAGRCTPAINRHLAEGHRGGEKDKQQGGGGRDHPERLDPAGRSACLG